MIFFLSLLDMKSQEINEAWVVQRPVPYIFGEYVVEHDRRQAVVYNVRLSMRQNDSIHDNNRSFSVNEIFPAYDKS